MSRRKQMARAGGQGHSSRRTTGIRRGLKPCRLHHAMPRTAYLHQRNQGANCSHNIAVQATRLYVVEDTLVNDHDVGSLLAVPLPASPGNRVRVATLREPLYSDWKQRAAQSVIIRNIPLLHPRLNFARMRCSAHVIPRIGIFYGILSRFSPQMGRYTETGYSAKSG